MKGIDIAETMLGWTETGQTSKLIDFFKKNAINNDIVLNPSTTPWCAAFVNACERQSGHKGTGKVNARSFLEYGTKVDLKDAKEGDICIFKRGNSEWQGHVTYFVSQMSPTSILCLGGNQNDRVCKQIYPKINLLGIRRP